MQAIKNPRRSKARPPAWLRWPVCALAMMASASCVPTAQEQAGFRLEIPVRIADVLTPAAMAATAKPAGLLPLGEPLPALTTPSLATSLDPRQALRGRTGLDQLRAADCLAQAIYYEAASESEDGQRAVAQVVLNRVRHPAWPNSVCGVVYQGPMRAGGGCQFTFTCDGALARRPGGSAWSQARRIAAEALAGMRFQPADLSTHYHTHAVSPSWAPRLRPTVVIGSHRFYALPGANGGAPAFAAAYRGSEPLPRPVQTIFRTAAATRFELPALASQPITSPGPSLAYVPAATTEPTQEETLPPSTIREEYRNSGQWRTDAPAAVTGR